MPSPQPFENLKFYQNICEIRRQTGKITARFDKSHMRLVSQMRDAARSAKQNIREGYRRGSLGNFLNSIRISQGSLEELRGDLEDCYEDKLISQQEFENLNRLIQSAGYMSTQYLKAMSKPENKTKWIAQDRA